MNLNNGKPSKFCHVGIVEQEWEEDNSFTTPMVNYEPFSEGEFETRISKQVNYDNWVRINPIL